MVTKSKKTVDLRKLWEDVNTYGKPAPKNESVWLTNPLIAFLFAKYYRKKPWTEEQEKSFYGNVKAIYSYVYWIVHDLGLERPQHLHNYMIAKSLDVDSSDKEWVDLYFQKIENKNKA
jgi:hypothetical protein